MQILFMVICELINYLTYYVWFNTTNDEPDWMRNTLSQVDQWVHF